MKTRSQSPPGVGRARARANIALAKYWGKADKALNLPAVPSISMTLDRLVTETEVRFDPALREDTFILDGKRVPQAGAKKMVRVLAAVRREARLRHRAMVQSENHFPTAAGLASSASGFAALVGAARKAAGLPYHERKIGRLARKSSASAARSVYGGFAELPAGNVGDDSLCARPLYDENHWDLRLVVALTATGPKAIGSTEGMERSRRTSPLYEAWVESAPKLTRRVRRGLKERNLDLLGRAMEQSTMSFHSCAHSSDPPIVYWKPATMDALQTVIGLRETGIPVFATMDAGPHVKALCEASHARQVRRALQKLEGVHAVWTCKAGSGIEVW